MSRRVVLTLVALLAAGCGGDAARAVNDVMQPMPAVTLSELQADVFTPRCAVPTCHAGAFPALGMSLEDGNTFASVVGVTSVEIGTFKRVEPGNAADSYLFMKVGGDPRIAGLPMPRPPNAPLDAADIARIATWIDDGALDN